MRLIDVKTKELRRSLSIYLTVDEANELKGLLEAMLASPTPHREHTHIYGRDNQNELAIELYDKEKLNDYAPAKKEIILKGGGNPPKII